ncbi:MAG TPA: diphthine synthase [Nitrososphaerales archaeon]|nr:diphthine synthase [Nitrososphaerales archaeon]
MGKLSFVGLGLGPRGISLEGLKEIRESDICYVEYYTTPQELELLSTLEKESGKEIVVVDREFVEDGGSILRDSKGKKVVLAVPGDPLIATTHNELRVRAIRQGVETRVVHGATVASALASASGLHYYKFGRTVTVTREAQSKPEQVYRLVHQNLLEGSHTLLLLEYDVEGREGVRPGEAVKALLDAESSFKRGVVSESTFGLVLSRIGREGAKYEAGPFSSLSKGDYGFPPFSLVIPGELHFTEVESIAAVFSVQQSAVHGNTEGLKRPAQTLVPKYVAKTKKALDSVRGSLGAQYGPVIENAELYMRDAENFLAKNDDELAMLSIGYAEGLLDSLSFSGVAKIDW